MIPGVLDFLCRLIPYTQEYNWISNLLWDATFPFFVQGIVLRSFRWQAVFIALLISLWIIYHRAFFESDISTLNLSMIYWGVVFVIISGIFGVIAGTVLRRMKIQRARFWVQLPIAMIIWQVGYAIAIEILLRTGHIYQAFTC